LFADVEVDGTGVVEETLDAFVEVSGVAVERNAGGRFRPPYKDAKTTAGEGGVGPRKGIGERG
jgi:hypothetical protein